MITFTSRLITFRKVREPSYGLTQLWDKLYHCCPCTRMTLALNNPQRLICHSNRNQAKSDVFLYVISFPSVFKDFILSFKYNDYCAMFLFQYNFNFVSVSTGTQAAYFLFHHLPIILSRWFIVTNEMTHAWNKVVIITGLC